MALYLFYWTFARTFRAGKLQLQVKGRDGRLTSNSIKKKSEWETLRTSSARKSAAAPVLALSHPDLNNLK